MTEDPWAEKPDWKAEVIEKDGKPFFDEDPIPIFEEMDAFHEKLRASFDESIADCHHSLELVAKKLGEYTEKAEKLETVREFVLSRRDDIEKDMENFGMLKPVLNYFLEEDGD